MAVSVDDLKGMVADSLRDRGTLGKIQAELRASVFFALDQRGYAAPNEPVKDTRQSHAPRFQRPSLS